MRFRPFCNAAFVITLMLAASAKAQPAPQPQDCTGKPGVDWNQQIKACTALIENGQASAHDRAVAYENRGNAYLDKGDDDHAMADYDAAIRLDPSLAVAYNDRGNIWLDREDPARAIAQFDAAIRLDPKFALAYGNRAAAYSQKGDFDRALVDADAEIRLAPKSAQAYIDRGYVHQEKGEFDAAIADYNQAIGLDPKSSAGHNSLGAVYLATGDWGRGVAEFNEAIRLDPHGSLAYENRGRAYFFAGSLPKALADFRQANVLAPQDGYPALWADIAEARSNVPSTLPQMAAKLDMKAWPAPLVRMFLGQMTPAAALAAAADPNATKQALHVCEAHFWSGEWALRRGSKDEALRLFRLAPSECPKTFNEWASAKAEIKTLGAKP
ncbi:MAG: tetratricopeptide repeat protein [Xanthobacteraceae bacterium]